MTLKRYLGLGRESSFGGVVAATRYIETVTRILPDQGFIIPDPICDASRDKHVLGAFRSRGSIGPFAVTPDNIGELINAVMGSEAYTKSGNASPYTHEWETSHVLDSYTFRIGAEIEERILVGMLCNRLTFKATHGEALMATGEVVGPAGAETTGSLATLTRANLSALTPLIYYQGNGTLKIATVDKSANIYDLELTIDNGIPIGRGNLGSRYFNTKRRGGRTVTGKLSCYFDDDDEYDRFIAGADFELDLKFVVSANVELAILIKEAIYLKDTAANVQPINEPLVVDAPFQAFWEDATYTELQIQLKNAESSSYT